MLRSYPVLWRESPGAPHDGLLVLGSRELRLDGMSEGVRRFREVPYSELTGVRMASGEAEELEGRPTLVIEARPGNVLQVSAVAGAGALREVADVLVFAMAGL